MTPYRLVTFTADGADHPGLLVGDRVLDLAQATRQGHQGTAHGSPTDLLGMIEGWSPRVAARVQAMADAGLGDGPGTYAVADVQLRTPIRNASHVLCIAANYQGHNKEMGRGETDVDPDNEEPVFFPKSPRNCIADPGAPFVMPAGRNIDSVSYYAHIAGGVAGGVDEAAVSPGFFFRKSNNPRTSPKMTTLRIMANTLTSMTVNLRLKSPIEIGSTFGELEAGTSYPAP